MLARLAASKWNFNTAAHLLNRAGFGGTPEENEKLFSLGFEPAVSSLIDYEKIEESTPGPEWARPDPERFARFKEARDATPEKKREMRRAEQKEQREHLQELRYGWLQRMAFGPRPLQEKLVLFWHGHFATSAQKVKNASLMWRQNEVFRRNASGNWLQLLTEVSKDPAMLVWLDQAQSRKEHPNENFAREVMELFALGEGHYTERDITEGARAFTGWTFDRLNQEFTYRPNWHDDGNKLFLGQSGRFTGDDALKIIVAQPQCARFITRKLWAFFASENPPDPLVDSLAAILRANRYELKPVLRALFSSEEFYSAQVMRQQVKSPVQWLVGSVKSLERTLPAPQFCANSLRTLGQDLLLPPNVKGWDGGLSWITTNNLINRYNYAAFLVLGEIAAIKGEKSGRPRRSPSKSLVEVSRLFPEELRQNKSALLAALEHRFLQTELKPEHKSTLRSYFESQGEIDETDLLQGIRLIMCTPEYQLI
ncbi:MAG TPA: DUF1800 domain-containing protein [Verrucomicrobiae bacterium]|nr:DUF1800 domain-containing protein [Verrucomicrobiae bacterium]